MVRGGEIAAAAPADRPQPRRPGADLRRHHPAGRRPAQRRLEGRRAAHRPRDQEPADADPALGRAPAAQVPQGAHRRPGDLRPLHRDHHPPGRRHRPHGRRVLGLRPHAGAEVRRAATRAELLRQAAFAQRVADPETQVDVVLPDGEVAAALRCAHDRPGADQPPEERRRGDRRAPRRRAAAARPHHGAARRRAPAGRRSRSRTTASACRPRTATASPSPTSPPARRAPGLASPSSIGSWRSTAATLTLADAAHLPGAKVSLRLPTALVPDAESVFHRRRTC